MRQPIKWWTDEWYGPDETPEYAGMHLTTRQGEYGPYVQANWFNIETREWTYRPYGMPLVDPLIAWTRMPIPCPLEREHPAAKEPTITQLDIDDVVHETAKRIGPRSRQRLTPALRLKPCTDPLSKLR